MLTRSMRADIGVMISASHNPFEDNGIKLFGPDGYKLSDELEAEINRLIDEDLTSRLSVGAHLGRAKRYDDGGRDRYVEFAKRTLPRDLSLDGVASPSTAPTARPIASRPTSCGSSAPRSSRSASIRTAPTSISTADRRACRPQGEGARGARRHRHRARRRRGPVLIVDEHGEVVDGDQIMAVIGEAWAQDGRLAAAASSLRSCQPRPRSAISTTGRSSSPAPRSATATCRAHARARLQCRRRAVRPHRPVGLRHHRRRPRLGAAGAGGGARGRRHRSEVCRKFTRRCRRS